MLCKVTNFVVSCIQSSLLLSILGNMRVTSGEIKHSSSVAYVSQESWIFSDTVRNNILLGERFDAKLFRQTIHDSGLDMVRVKPSTQIKNKFIIQFD